jgi:2-dehydro-3-deoxyphosphogluconate aldolase / (4S)-4-hydroxy-2-oxoglutarate aldolase
MTASIDAICARAPVIPVIIIERLRDAAPLARALVAGGLPVLEVTLRSPVALEAIAMMAAEAPGAVIGAGTVLDPRQADDAAAAGAQFIVSPGTYDALTDHILHMGIPYLPGVATPSEMMALLAKGVRYQKLFPAAVVGGMEMLKAVASPLPQIRFCPTGGITPASAPDFLRLPNVVCVGGSWMAPAKMIEAQDWPGIEALARQAAALRP